MPVGPGSIDSCRTPGVPSGLPRARGGTGRWRYRHPVGWTVSGGQDFKRAAVMVVVGVDAHKATHTLVAVDAVGCKLSELTVQATTAGHHKALDWGRSLDAST